MVVPRTMTVLEPVDLDAAAVLLAELYKLDRLNMPFAAPDFEPKAALWAANYVFRVCQLILLRDIGESELQNWLVPYSDPQTPSAIYSADLLLRFMSDLFRLSSGLSPEDPLVHHLREAAVAWPFSSVGIKGITAGNVSNILGHPSLKQAYIDRLIARKDMERLRNHTEKELLKETLGAHRQTLWPGLDLLLTDDQL